MSFKYEIGDRFLDPSDDEKGTIVYRLTTGGVDWYWMAPDDHITPWTIGGDSLEHWKKIEPFFEVGDWWVDESGNRFDITHVDTDIEEPAAWARCTYVSRSTGYTTFTSVIWRSRRDQIIRNREV